MPGIRVAVTSRSFSRHPVLRAELAARYPDVTFNDDGRSLEGDALAAFLAGHERAITALDRVDDALLRCLPELRVIAKYGVGLDMLDLEAMTQRGVKLGWTAGVNRRSVAELVIALAIASLRHVPRATKLVEAGEWRQLVGRQLSDRVVGIVGCGHVGKEVVRLLRPFGCRMLSHDVKDFAAFYAEHSVRAASLHELLETCDVVTLHLPLTAATRGILSADRLARMRQDAILINTARGGLVDEAVLKAMLREGRLAGAAFDVFTDEPPGDRDLLQIPNFIATPHIGGSAEEAVLAMGRAAIRGLDDFGDPRAVAGDQYL